MSRKPIVLLSRTLVVGACFLLLCSAPAPGPRRDRHQTSEEALQIDYASLCPETQRELQDAFSAALAKALRRAEQDPTLQYEMKLLHYIDDIFPWNIALSIWLVKPGK